MIVKEASPAVPSACHANDEKARRAGERSKRPLNLMVGEDQCDERIVVAEEAIAPL